LVEYYRRWFTPHNNAILIVAGGPSGGRT